MSSMTRWLPALIAGTFLCSACDRTPTGVSVTAEGPSVLRRASADRSVEESLIDLEGVYVAFSCSPEGDPLDAGEGELVRLSGQVYHKITERRDARDGLHITVQSMPVGLEGIGQTTGEPFRVIEREHATYSQTQTGFNGAWRSEMRLTGRETGRTFRLVVFGTYRLSADGDVVMDRSGQTVTCRPDRRSQP